MCDPVTLSVAAIGTSVVAGGMSAYGQYKSAAATKAGLIQQSQDAQRNAAIASLNSQSILDFADINVASLLGTTDLNARVLTQTTQMQGAATMALAGINARSTEQIAGINAAASVDIAAINTGIKSAVGDYNLSVANGNYDMLMATAEQNADFAEADAQAALGQGRSEEQQSRMAYAQAKSSQRTALAANGVALDSDSSVRMLTSTDWATEMDATQIYNNAQRAAYGYRVQGHQIMNEARLKGFALKADAMGAKLSLDGDVLRERADATFSAAQTVAAGGMDAFNIRQSAAMAAFSAQMNAEWTAADMRNTAASEALNLRTNATMSAMDARIQSTNYTSQGRALSSTAASISPGFAAATSLMGTASQVAGQWYGMSKAGVFSGGGKPAAGASGGSYYMNAAGNRAVTRMGA